MMSQPIDGRMKEVEFIDSIRDKCANQAMADMLHYEGYSARGERWKTLIGDDAVLYQYHYNDSDFEW